MAMYKAIDSGDAAEIMRLVHEDPILVDDARGYRDGRTPLIYAARFGKLDMVKLLVENGASINATTHVRETALHYAAGKGHVEVVAYLLSNGAQPGAQEEGGYTPLIVASIKGHTRVVSLLLDHMGGQGLELSIARSGCTALHEAASAGREEVVTYLLRHGARADTTDKDGVTALKTAVSRGHVGVVKLLVGHMGTQALQEQDQDGGSLLNTAIRESHEDMVAYLLGKGLSPTVMDNRGVTPLMYAAQNSAMRVSGHRSVCAGVVVVQRLLGHVGRQGLDTRDAVEGRTALHYAASRSNAENVRALLLAGADPTIMDHEGRTPRRSISVYNRRETEAVFEWWDGELERRSLLYRAKALHNAHMTHQQAPTCPVPAFLRPRVGAGRTLPRVEVVDRDGATTKTAAAQEQQERHAMLGLVVKGMSEELFTELMHGFPTPRS